MAHVTYLTLKSVGAEGERIVEGWATTPREDRVGDVVVPEGARYQLPQVLLFGHDHGAPIGSVISATVTKAGIRIRARISKGVAKADEVWTLIQDRALNSVSIGFRALKTSPLPTGGTRFDEWDWYETSIVSVPCQPDARIAVGKSVAYSIGAEVAGPVAVPAPAKTRPAKMATGADIDIIEFGKGLGEIIREAVAPLKAQLADVADLRDRLKRIETEALHDAGFYAQGKTYSKGAMVTHDGATYVATDETSSEPGGCYSWRLIGRKGR